MNSVNIIMYEKLKRITVLVCYAFIFLISSTSSFAEEISWSAKASAGYDSNIYRAPDKDYIDYGKRCTPNAVEAPTDICQTRGDGQAHPFVNPDMQSGTFFGINLKGDYLTQLNGKFEFVANYKFSGQFYLDSNNTNADQYRHRISAGAQHVFNTKGKKRDSVYFGLMYSHKKRLYLDRDSGDEQVFDNADVSERYTYDMVGSEIRLKKRTGDMQYKLGAEYQNRDYVDEVVISEYDHDYYKFGGDVSYRINKATKFSVGYDYSIYEYSDRPSRNAQGDLLKSNPKREYEYNLFKATVRHRFNKTWLAYLDYENKERKDRYQSYDNYTKNLIKTRIHYKFNRNNDLKASLSYWERDYPNAYAFDDFEYYSIKGIKKEYDGITVNLDLETRKDKHVSYVSSVKYTDEDSTDLRYKYDRYQVSFGFVWES